MSKFLATLTLLVCTGLAAASATEPTPSITVTGHGAQFVRVLAPALAEGMPPQTSVQANFANADTADPDEIEREKALDANQFLQWTNRVLRRYRAVTRRADIIELTRAGHPIPL